ncbi:MAG TPA: AraC family transcriptional regulator [Mobilitalea sp.]|nr:AraC family transcriptional regulator [Mobilitalea sp.]
MIHINFGGCDSRHTPGCIIASTHGNQDYLIIVAKTNATFEIDGSRYETLPGSMVIFDKNIPYRYWNSHGEYVNDWLHFDFYEEAPSFHSLSIPLNQVFSLNHLPAITLLMNQIISELYSDSSHRDEIIDYFMHILLIRLSEQIHSKEDPIRSHPLYPQMSTLRATMYNFSEEKWTIDRMCSDLHISSSYFQHLYKKMFQISCINDLVNARIEAAKFRLRRTNLQINDISELCGYENEVHFCRQFKKNTGLSPREYRNKLTNEDYIPDRTIVEKQKS